MVIVVIIRFDNAICMYRCSCHNEKMEYLMRAAPDIKSAGFDRFGYAGPVEKGSNDKQKAFEKVVRHPTLSIHLRETVEFGPVDERREP